MTNRIDVLGRKLPKKTLINSMPTWRLEQLAANDYRNEVNKDYGNYKDDIDYELARRCVKRDLIASREFKRKQRQELKRLEETLPF